MGKKRGSGKDGWWKNGAAWNEPVSRIWVGPNTDMDEDFITISAVGSRRGDTAEAEFIARACGLSFRVAKPWGNIDRYDALIGMGRGFWRVQVKCGYLGVNGCYYTGSGRRGYTKDEIDFVAAYLVALNVWYIVPIEVCEGRPRLYFNPGGRGKYERYREAWCLLACPPKARGWKDVPVVCRCRGQLPTRCAVCPRGASDSHRKRNEAHSRQVHHP